MSEPGYYARRAADGSLVGASLRLPVEGDVAVERPWRPGETVCGAACPKADAHAKGAPLCIVPNLAAARAEILASAETLERRARDLTALAEKGFPGAKEELAKVEKTAAEVLERAKEAAAVSVAKG